MDAVDYIRTDVKEQAKTFDIYREQNSGSYGSQKEFVGTVDITVSTPNPQDTVEVEGSDDDASLVGWMIPQDEEMVDGYDALAVGDELRLTTNDAKRYSVRSIQGFPNDLDPELIQLGLDSGG